MPVITSIRRRALFATTVVLAAAFAAPALATPTGAAGGHGPKHVMPVYGSASGQAQGGQSQGGQSKGGGGKPPKPTYNGIDYHNGPVMLGTTNVYYIWYGDWTKDPSANGILTDFASTVGGSPYFGINTTYYDASGHHVANSVHYAGSTTDAYSAGPVLDDAAIQTIVARAVTSGALPVDSHGVYFVLTSGDVQETTGFGSSYCGWHTYGSISGQLLKYSFVGDPFPAYMANCAWDPVGPNGAGGGDAMASVVAHELEETATDPLLNAWWGPAQYDENADKCAWTFGTTYPSGTTEANMHLGNRDYLIQQNWVNGGGGYCALSL